MSRASRAGATASGDPFAALGLPATGGATDDDVRAAWRRIASATHPDRDDGGDPARFAAAAAAYATLRTAYGRGEALADLRTPAQPAPAPAPASDRHYRNVGRRLAPLGVRIVVAAAVSAGAVLATGWSPGAFGVLAGAATWVIAAARRASGKL